jgi:hypothetical protein
MNGFMFLNQQQIGRIGNATVGRSFGIRRTTLNLTLTVLLVQPGCSWLFVRTVPDKDASPRIPDKPVCTESNTFPIVDSIVAFGGGIVALAPSGERIYSTDPAEQQRERDSRRNIAALRVFAFIVAVTAFSSAMWGYYHTHECRKQNPARPVVGS